MKSKWYNFTCILIADWLWCCVIKSTYSHFQTIHRSYTLLIQEITPKVSFYCWLTKCNVGTNKYLFKIWFKIVIGLNIRVFNIVVLYCVGLCEISPCLDKQLLVFPGYKVGSLQLVVSAACFLQSLVLHSKMCQRPPVHYNLSRTPPPPTCLLLNFPFSWTYLICW